MKETVEEKNTLILNRIKEALLEARPTIEARIDRYMKVDKEIVQIRYRINEKRGQIQKRMELAEGFRADQAMETVKESLRSFEEHSKKLVAMLQWMKKATLSFDKIARNQRQIRYIQAATMEALFHHRKVEQTLDELQEKDAQLFEAEVHPYHHQNFTELIGAIEEATEKYQQMKEWIRSLEQEPKKEMPAADFSAGKDGQARVSKERFQEQEDNSQEVMTHGR